MPSLTCSALYWRRSIRSSAQCRQREAQVRWNNKIKRQAWCREEYLTLSFLPGALVSYPFKHLAILMYSSIPQLGDTERWIFTPYSAPCVSSVTVITWGGEAVEITALCKNKQSCVLFLLRNMCYIIGRLHTGPWLIFTQEKALGLWPTIPCKVGLNPMQKTLVLTWVSKGSAQSISGSQLLKNWLRYTYVSCLLWYWGWHGGPHILLASVLPPSHVPRLSFPFRLAQFRPGVCCFKKARHKTLELTPIQTNCAITKRTPGFMLRFTMGFL